MEMKWVIFKTPFKTTFSRLLFQSVEINLLLSIQQYIRLNFLYLVQFEHSTLTIDSLPIDKKRICNTYNSRGTKLDEFSNHSLYF